MHILWNLVMSYASPGISVVQRWIFGGIPFLRRRSHVSQMCLLAQRREGPPNIRDENGGVNLWHLWMWWRNFDVGLSQCHVYQPPVTTNFCGINLQKSQEVMGGKNVWHCDKPIKKSPRCMAIWIGNPWWSSSGFGPVETWLFIRPGKHLTMGKTPFLRGKSTITGNF